MADRGVVGRFGVDFAAVQDARQGWALYGLEINLRRGGTSHPYDLLHNLVPGRYDPAAGTWRSADDEPRSYRSTDNLVDPRRTGLSPSRAIDAVRAAGLAWDRHRRTGVVLHMLSCLAVDGRVGLNAIGATPESAQAMFAAAAETLDDLHG